MKNFLLTLLLFSTPFTSNVFASEVDCIGRNWSFTIEENTAYKVGSLIFRGNILEQMQLVEKSVAPEEYTNLRALYEGETSEDSYSLVIFKEKENNSYVSFLQSESILGHKKVIELRCKLRSKS